MTKVPGAARRVARPVSRSLGWFTAAALVYWVTAAVQHNAATPPMSYFDQLADAFRHGRLHLERPAVTHDLTQHDGRWYVPFLPLPALLLLPWVAVRGVAHTNTVAFASLLGGLNVVTANLVLRATVRRGWTSLSPWAVRWLTVAFGFATVQWYMATQGSVWFLSQLCATAALLLAMLAAVERRPMLAGTGVAVAMLARPHLALARPHLALALPVILAIALAGRAGDDVSSGTVALRTLARRLIRPVAVAMVPVAIAVVAIGAYDLARFGSVNDSGYLAQNVDRRLAGDLREFGQFDVHFVRHNVWAALAAGPVWDERSARPQPNPDGMSVVLTSPFVLLAAKASRKRREVRWLWLGVAALAVPLVLYYNTGWYQFGYRFALDLWPLLLVLVALGARDRARWTWCSLVVVGVLMNWWGAAWFS